MAGRRRFSNAFKSQVVEEFLAGELTQVQLARRYGISDSDHPVEEALRRREVRTDRESFRQG